MDALNLTAVVLTKNGQQVLPACLSSLNFASEIIVIDDYSSDCTFQTVLRFKACRFYRRRLAGNFSAQRNFAFSRTHGQWILYIDDDEIVSYELAEEIQCAIQTKKSIGYYIPRQDVFLNKTLKYGETKHIKLLRLVKKDHGFWQGKVHEKMIAKGPVGQLYHPLIHRRTIGISDFIDKINWYSSLVALEKKELGMVFSWKEFIFYPAGKFLQNYCLKLGFLDGMEGLIMGFLMSLHSLFVRTKMHKS